MSRLYSLSISNHPRSKPNTAGKSPVTISTSLLIVVFLVKEQCVIDWENLPFQLTFIPDYISYIIFFLVPVILTFVSLPIANRLEGDSLEKVNHLVESGEKLVNNSDVKIGDLLDIAVEMMDGFATKAESIANEMESASMNMNEATNTIRKNPSSLIFKNKTKVADEDL